MDNYRSAKGFGTVVSFSILEISANLREIGAGDGSSLQINTVGAAADGFTHMSVNQGFGLVLGEVDFSFNYASARLDKQE